MQRPAGGCLSENPRPLPHCILHASLVRDRLQWPAHRAKALLPLAAHDAGPVGSDSLPLTHKFLAIMLGVRRATVTEVLRPLQERGAIDNGRGVIKILDRPGLEALACECYQAIKQEFARVFEH
jgi:Crp-like helix-turn-helix protein